MKRFIKINNKDKVKIKMLNQTEKSFELVILDENLLKEYLEFINNCESKGDEIYVVWQMKWKDENHTVYKNCKFSHPMENLFKNEKDRYYKNSVPKPFGKKLKVTCDSAILYSNSVAYKNGNPRNSRNKYKDGKLLERLLKIGELEKFGDDRDWFFNKSEK